MGAVPSDTKSCDKDGEISEGNFEAQITDMTNLRKSDFNRTFNTMVEEIKHLKITVYEDALREQKTKLAWLQMQIRPHFPCKCAQYGLFHD